MNWVIEIDMYTLMCVKWMTNEDLLHEKIKNKSYILWGKKKVIQCLILSLPPFGITQKYIISLFNYFFVS